MQVWSRTAGTVAGQPAGDRLLQERAQRSAAQWRRLGLHLRSVTPRDILRLLLVTAALYAVLWLAVESWPALLPFVAGGLIGYAVLPIVNALDRFFPRPLAALLTMTGVLCLVGLFLAVLVPPLAVQLVRLYQSVPSLEELREAVERLRQQLGTLPLPAQDFVRDAWARASASLRANLEVAVGRSAELAVAGLLGLFNALSFFLGLLVIPTWLLSVVAGQRRAAREVDRTLPSWLRADFWAVVQIVDRAFGAFVRGQLLVALAVGGLTYAGLQGLGWLGWPVGYPLVLAVVAALFQLVPQLGPLVSAVLGALVGFSASPGTGLAVLGMYYLVQRLVGAFVGSRVERRVSDLHPAILVLVIVALSQLGWQWIFLAAPVTAVARDLWRYAFGRLGDPPRPAGVLPGAAPAAGAAGAAGSVVAPAPAGAQGGPYPPLPGSLAGARSTREPSGCGAPAPRPLPLVYRRTQEARGAWRRSEAAQTSPS